MKRFGKCTHLFSDREWRLKDWKQSETANLALSESNKLINLHNISCSLNLNLRSVEKHIIATNQ